MKDAVATMGTILPSDAKGKDAVHVAVIAVEAAENMWSGRQCGVQLTDNGYIASSNLTPHIGIVDPFLLDKSVEAKQKFWLYLFPRTITGLSHVWSHPAFPDALPTGAEARSEQWMRTFIASANCPDYDVMMAVLKRIANGELSGSIAEPGEDDDYNHFRLEDEYLHFNGLDAHGSIPPEFWEHASVMVGKTIKGARPTYFSCSC